MHTQEKRFVFRTAAGRGQPPKACQLLADGSGLPRMRVKEAMLKGAVWLVRKGSHQTRLRRASAVLRAGDEVVIYYDAHLLARIPPRAECRHDAGRYSIWFKPAGLLAQGSRFGDHCSLLRQVEVCFRPGRRAYLVHRLDREASGLMIIAHDHQAAVVFSEMFAGRRIVKRYRIEVLGRVGAERFSGRIDQPLDARQAVTDYTVVSYDPAAGTSLLNVEMQTGRRHQIRRHFALLGFPVMGDPLYGTGNKNSAGLKLTACGLEFACPFTGRAMVFELSPMS
jgi:tRNA pseudouridine32 synthase / 23S rRNA pseudouridine746 synthase